MLRPGGNSYVRDMAQPDRRPTATSRAESTPQRPLWRRALTAVLVALGVYLVLRAAVEPFLVDFGDPSDYSADWGGPSLIGVLAVHMVPGIISAVLLLVWWRRRTS